MKRPRAFCNASRGAPSLTDKRGALGHGPLGQWVNPPLGVDQSKMKKSNAERCYALVLNGGGGNWNVISYQLK